jgi:hypothetical protein
MKTLDFDEADMTERDGKIKKNRPAPVNSRRVGVNPFVPAPISAR